MAELEKQTDPVNQGRKEKMTEQKRTSYCRACGENKGHSFAQCKNVAEMKQIIASQDNETKSFQAQMNSMKADVARIPKLEETDILLHRVLQSLLELCEKNRSERPRT